MNYFLLLLILLVCGGAYYEHTQDAQSLAAFQKNVSDLSDQVASLQADNAKLTSDNSDLKAKLAEATANVKNLTDAAKSTVATPAAPSSTAAAATPTPAGAAAAPTAGKASIEQMAQGVVLIKGDNAQGTGFLVKTADGPVVVTNLHVLANNPHLQITSSSGAAFTITGMKGAADRDLAMLTVKDGPYTYLPLETDDSKTVQAGDAVITPGDSQGGNVVLNTSGKVLALGADRVEIDNPIYHGNSGGPVFRTSSGTVIAVVTEAMKVDVSNDLDKASFASRNSAIASSMRYFGLRLDTVPKWEVYDMARYQDETALLDQFDEQSRRLDSYLNSSSGNGSPNNASSSNNDSRPYLSDQKIVAAHEKFRQALPGTDTSGQIDALRELCFSLDSIADKNVIDIQNSNNFYSFDQQRAKDELAYRTALKSEIKTISSDINRIGNLPRIND